MRYYLLDKIDASDPLAQLFNQYLKGLSTLAIMAEPSYVTMAEVRTRYAKTGKRKDRNHLKDNARRFFELTVLRNTLHELHAHVLKAIVLLEDFFTTYESNLTRYAIENRLRSIAEYGSDEDSDWAPDGTDEQGQPRWKVTYRDDEESLQYYTLHHELGHHFGVESRGEYIGTSGPEDFYPYSAMVEQQSAFSFRRMLSAFSGQEVTITRLAEDGTQTPMTLADHLEDELNEDLRSQDLVLRFNTVLGLCASLGQLYRRLAPAGPESYQHLLTCLRLVREVQTEGHPPF